MKKALIAATAASAAVSRARPCTPNLFSPIFAHTTINANGDVASFVVDSTGGPCH